MALNALGGTPVRPAALAFFSFLTALLNSSQPIGSLSSHSVRRCVMCSNKVGLVEQWLLKTRWKCGASTDMFSDELVARDPSGKRIAIAVCHWWCADSPFVSRHMCSQVRHGSIHMSWILEQMSAYHLALAWVTACATCSSGIWVWLAWCLGSEWGVHGWLHEEFNCVPWLGEQALSGSFGTILRFGVCDVWQWVLPLVIWFLDSRHTPCWEWLARWGDHCNPFKCDHPTWFLASQWCPGIWLGL